MIISLKKTIGSILDTKIQESHKFVASLNSVTAPWAWAYKRAQVFLDFYSTALTGKYTQFGMIPVVYEAKPCMRLSTTSSD